MRHRFFIFSLFIIYMLALTIIMMWQGIVIAPTRYLFILLLGSLFVKRTRSFILDWGWFILILISYDFLRSFTPNLIFQTHYLEMINFDLSIFGVVPTQFLQKTFFHPGNLAWYDYLATLFYFLHYFLPISSAFLFYLYSKKHFREFITGISLLSYAGWITYLIFPAAPPWVASNAGYLMGVSKIMDSTLASIFGYDFPTVYHNLNPNPIGSVPSIHSAWAVLLLLFAIRTFKIKGLFFLPYVLGIWISIIYLGEHYVFDLLAGAFYAVFFYLFTTRVLHKIDWQKLFSKENTDSAINP